MECRAYSNWIHMTKILMPMAQSCSRTWKNRMHPETTSILQVPRILMFLSQRSRIRIQPLPEDRPIWVRWPTILLLLPPSINLSLRCAYATTKPRARMRSALINWSKKANSCVAFGRLTCFTSQQARRTVTKHFSAQSQLGDLRGISRKKICTWTRGVITTSRLTNNKRSQGRRRAC